MIWFVAHSDARAQAENQQSRNLEIAWDVLSSVGTNYELRDDQLFANGVLLNNRFDLVDRIARLTGGTVTIFAGDTRIATNVPGPNGGRAVGTQASAPIVQAVITGNQPYRGEADVVGTPSFTAYDPIRNGAGEVVGMLFTGIPQADYFAPVTRLSLLIIVSMSIAVLAMSLVAFLVARRSFAPLVALTGALGQVAQRRTDVAIVGRSRHDEIGDIARSVENLRVSVDRQMELEAQAESNHAEREAEAERTVADERAKAEELQAFVADIRGGFEQLAAGNLTVRLERPVAEQYTAIQTSFNATLTRLFDTMGSVVTSIGSIRTGLGEINVASNDLAQRTEQQAASLEETVAALAEVTRAANATARDAEQARSTADHARTNAEKGGQIVGRTVEAMRGIEKSSEEINKIIGVIDEIAFQTNLLALNAGVEAARAGEAGRGFAVVAQEVRGLAQRSAEAAKEIKTLISASRVQVGEGVELVSASGRSLEEIIEGVGQVNIVIAEIARRASEQAVSLKEVSTAADQMDKVTQQNAAMVEEATAAAQTLANETDELARLIDQFRLASSQGYAERRERRSEPSTHRAPVVQMRTRGTGGAAPAAIAGEWEEF